MKDTREVTDIGADTECEAIYQEAIAKLIEGQPRAQLRRMTHAFRHRVGLEAVFNAGRRSYQADSEVGV
jgi:hypothetical protein